MEISDQIKVFKKLHNVPRETIEQFTKYHDLLIKHQEKTNLVGSGTVSTIWIRHFSDSAKLTDRIITYTNNMSSTIDVCDVGSGAGFPGLVLAILGAGDVKLVESDQRKAVFLQTVIWELGLSACVINQRIENLPACQPDVITARALAALPKLMSLIEPQFHNGLTCLFLKGACVDEELTNFQSYSTMIPQLYPSDQ